MNLYVHFLLRIINNIAAVYQKFLLQMMFCIHTLNQYICTMMLDPWLCSCMMLVGVVYGGGFFVNFFIKNKHLMLYAYLSTLVIIVYTTFMYPDNVIYSFFNTSLLGPFSLIPMAFFVIIGLLSRLCHHQTSQGSLCSIIRPVFLSWSFCELPIIINPLAFTMPYINTVLIYWFGHILWLGTLWSRIKPLGILWMSFPILLSLILSSNELLFEHIKIIFSIVLLGIIFFSSKFLKTPAAFWWMVQSFVVLRFYYMMNLQPLDNYIQIIYVINLVSFFVASIKYKIPSIAYGVRHCLHFISVFYISLLFVIPVEIWAIGGGFISLCGFGILWALKPLIALEEYNEDNLQIVYHSSIAQTKVWLYIFSSLMLLTVLVVGGIDIINTTHKTTICITGVIFFLTWCVAWLLKWKNILKNFQTKPEQVSVVYMDSESNNQTLALFSHKEHNIGLSIIIVSLVGFLGFFITCTVNGYRGYDVYGKNMHLDTIYIYIIGGMCSLSILFFYIKKYIKISQKILRMYNALTCGIEWVGTLFIMQNNETYISCALEEPISSSDNDELNDDTQIGGFDV